MILSVFDDMTQATEAEVQRMLNLVGEPRRTQALRFKFLSGRFEQLKSWLMLVEILEGMGVDDFELKHNAHGKPALAHYPDIHFSISHCKHGLAVAVDDKPVGIDIECIRKASPELIRKTMNADEIASIHDATDFIRLWTMKEAVLKLRGTGIIGELHHVLDGQSYQLETHVNHEKQYVITVARQVKP